MVGTSSLGCTKLTSKNSLMIRHVVSGLLQRSSVMGDWYLGQCEAGKTKLGVLVAEAELRSALA